MPSHAMHFFGLGLALFAAVPLSSHAATTVFVNRCVGNCQFSAGADNAVTNTSSVLSVAVSLTAFQHGDAAFAQVTACVTELLAPFDIVVTTIDPSPASHFELVVAGTAAQAGQQGGVTGLAPQACGVVPNAPVFAFANSIGNDPTIICETAVSQLGAVASLEVLFNCPDVMSFLNGCGPKSFRNENSNCGGFQAASCVCGGSTRNSYLVMRAAFGAADRLFNNGFEN